MINLNPVKGSEQSGYRPAIIVSEENFNIVMNVVTVLPLTSYKTGRIIYPSEVFLSREDSGLSKESIAMAHQIRTIAKSRLIKNVGEIWEDTKRNEIKEATRIHLDMI